MSRGTNIIPRIQIGISSINLTYSNTQNPVTTITPTTDPLFNALPFGYTAILYDREAAIVTSDGLPGSATVPVFLGDTISENAVVVRGTTFSISPRDVSTITQTQLVIVGNQTGASITVPVTINPATVV